MHIQGDKSGCAKPPIDFKTKVPPWRGILQATGDGGKVSETQEQEGDMADVSKEVAREVAKEVHEAGDFFAN